MNPVRTIYFDHASTTRPDTRVREAMLPYLGEEYGNPSSHYYPLGQRSSKAVDQARAEVAALIGAKPEEIIFTSGGTEANNLAIKGLLAEAPKGKDHVVTSNIEHYSVLNALRALSGRGFSVTYLPVDDGGLLDPARVAAAITERTALVTVMQANGEIGVVQDIAALAGVAARRGIPFFSDGVAAVGTMPVDVGVARPGARGSGDHGTDGPRDGHAGQR
jgi:cysteine desulfurase